MARLINPVLFSQRFGVDPSLFETAGILDPLLNSDTRLFIDPLLLPTCGNELISGKGFKTLKDHFANIVRLIAASATPGDVAWRTAARLLNLDERPETGLGYGGATTSGSSRPKEVKYKILSTVKEIVTLGENDPQIISLMGIFEEGVGPDTISDLTTNIIIAHLCTLTNVFCQNFKIPTKVFSKFYNAALPENPFRFDSPVIFVPRDILRELPLAAAWSDVSRVVNEIGEIRDRFNTFIGSIAEATVKERKDALRTAVLSSLTRFRQFFHEILASSDNYDPNEDILNFYAFRNLLASDLTAFAGKIRPQAERSREELQRIVTDIISHFRRLIEHNNMWELLWTPTGKPKRERASQLLFFAVADIFCKANNIDISPETHSGGGPVDFKFSTGYRNRVLVEVKRSTGTVEHGYKRQIETYKEAAGTDAAIFMVMDVGGMGKKLANIRIYRDLVISQGLKASQIEVIDAKRRISASKREDDWLL
ncbi:MAG TPA: hypothetical protein VHY35_01480 [Stellaceae bacterium]|nr:hypothetical protein [Stellaceae bacterium]